jgi:hypothetical protein
MESLRLTRSLCGFVARTIFGGYWMEANFASYTTVNRRTCNFQVAISCNG